MRVSEGTRTPDRLDHNQELYQLSYAHRADFESTSGRRMYVFKVNNDGLEAHVPLRSVQKCVCSASGPGVELR
jgi:hypothetical protein